MLERTLCLLKPDAIKRQLMGVIFQYFEQRGLKVVALKLLKPTEKQIETHYESILPRLGEGIYRGLVDFLQEAPIVAFILQGDCAVSVVRKICGTTEPKTADVGTIRGDFAHQSYGTANDADQAVRNLIHASSSLEEAEQEIRVWFTEKEIVAYTGNDEFDHYFERRG